MPRTGKLLNRLPALAESSGLRHCCLRHYVEPYQNGRDLERIDLLPSTPPPEHAPTIILRPNALRKPSMRIKIT